MSKEIIWDDCYKIHLSDDGYIFLYFMPCEGYQETRHVLTPDEVDKILEIKGVKSAQ